MFQFGQCAPDLLARGFQLRAVHQRTCAGEPPVRTPGDSHHHLQIPHQFQRRRCCRRRGTGLFLRFQKQLRLFENPLTDSRRGIAPGRVELSGLTAGASMPGQSPGHTLAVLETDARHRRQILHRRVGRDGAHAYFLLNAFGKQFHQGQPPRNPTHAPVEPLRQIVEGVTETLFQFQKQPALFQRRLGFRKTQRAVQYQRFGFTHLPHHRLHRVPSQLLQCRNPLVPINDLITAGLVLNGDHHDRHLLSGCGQRGQQPPLPFRTTDTQMLQSLFQLMKLQLHPHPFPPRDLVWAR